MKTTTHLFLTVLFSVCINCLFSQTITGYNPVVPKTQFKDTVTFTKGVKIFNQAGLVVGGYNRGASALGDFQSTTKGFLVPRMNSTQRDAISSPATGLLIYNTRGYFNYYSGSSWLEIGLLMKSGNCTTVNGDSIDLGGNANKPTDVEIGSFAIGFIGDGFAISAGNLDTYGGLPGYDSSVYISANKSVVFIGDSNCTFQSAGGKVNIVSADSITIDAGNGILTMENDLLPKTDKRFDLGRTGARWGNVHAVNYSMVDTVYIPTTGQTITVNKGYYSIVKPAGSLVALTVSLPLSPINGDVVELKFTQSVTTLSYTNGTVGNSALTTIALTNPYEKLVYNSATTTWY